MNLLEQPRVLDGDDGLVGEGLEQIDLSVGEGASLGSPDYDHTDRFTRKDQWDSHCGPEAKASGAVATLWILSLALQVAHMDSLPIENGTSLYMPTYQGHHFGCADWPMVGDEPEHLTVHLTDHRVIGIAKAGRAGRDLYEHVLQVRRRA